MGVNRKARFKNPLSTHKPGHLHRALSVPVGHVIPTSKLEEAARGSTEIARSAQRILIVRRLKERKK